MIVNNIFISNKVNENFLKQIAYDYNTNWINKRNTFIVIKLNFCTKKFNL